MKSKRFRKGVSVLLSAAMAASCLTTGLTTLAAGHDLVLPQGEQALGKAQPRFPGYRVEDIKNWNAETDPFSDMVRARVPLQQRNEQFSNRPNREQTFFRVLSQMWLGVNHNAVTQPILLPQPDQQADASPHPSRQVFFIRYSQYNQSTGQLIGGLGHQLAVAVEHSHLNGAAALHVAHPAAIEILP